MWRGDLVWTAVEIIQRSGAGMCLDNKTISFVGHVSISLLFNWTPGSRALLWRVIFGVIFGSGSALGGVFRPFLSAQGSTGCFCVFRHMVPQLWPSPWRILYAICIQYSSSCFFFRNGKTFFANSKLANATLQRRFRVCSVAVVLCVKPPAQPQREQLLPSLVLSEYTTWCLTSLDLSMNTFSLCFQAEDVLFLQHKLCFASHSLIPLKYSVTCRNRKRWVSRRRKNMSKPEEFSLACSCCSYNT